MSAIEDTEDRPIQSDKDTDPNLSEFQRLKEEIREAMRHRGKWREEARECFKFVNSDQWSEDDKQILADEGRPVVTFNRTAPMVKAVCGLEVNNRQGVVYLPRTQDDTGINEMFTNAGKWIRDECNAEDEESSAFRDMVICGEGWTETRMDFDEDPVGKVVEERISPLEMGVNKGAFRSNYVDARMIFRIREMDPEDVRALLDLPDDLSDAAIDASKWLDTWQTPEDGGTGNKKDYPKETRAAVKGKRGALKTVKIVQCQYWKRVPVNMVAVENAEEPEQLTDEEFATFQERATAAEIQFEHARTMKKVYYECFIGIRILDTKEMEMGQFQFKAMTGERDEEMRCFYGMVRDMRDPQRWSNKWLSQSINIMNRNAKGGLLAETDAFTNIRKAQRDWADPSKIVWAKPGSLSKNKIKERQAPNMPPGLEQLMMFAISSIRDVTGINLELLGQADREQAASLEQQRRQSATTILATMFDSLRKYRKHQGRLLLHFIDLLPEGTLIRILDQGQIKYVPFAKGDMDISKFDVIIDQAPSSPDQKQYIWAITAQILQMGILPPQAVVELLKYSPYPESVVAEIRAALGLDGPSAEQLQQKLQQAEEALQMLEQELQEATKRAEKVEGDRSIEVIKEEINEYKAETDRLNAQWNARIKMASAVAKRADGEGGDAGSSVVNTGEIELPDLGGQSNGNSNAALEAKVDELAAMISQLAQAIGGGQQQMGPPVPPPDALPTEEPLA